MAAPVPPRLGLLATIEYGLTAYADEDGMDQDTRAEVLAGLAEAIGLASELYCKVKDGAHAG
ncbi:MAG: hypothetical protein ACXWVD_00335 [Telluria sp.]